MNIIDIGYIQRLDEEAKLNRLIDVPWGGWAPFVSQALAVRIHVG